MRNTGETPSQDGTDPRYRAVFGRSEFFTGIPHPAEDRRETRPGIAMNVVTMKNPGQPTAATSFDANGPNTRWPTS